MWIFPFHMEANNCPQIPNVHHCPQMKIKMEMGKKEWSVSGEARSACKNGCSVVEKPFGGDIEVAVEPAHDTVVQGTGLEGSFVRQCREGRQGKKQGEVGLADFACVEADAQAGMLQGREGSPCPPWEGDTSGRCMARRMPRGMRAPDPSCPVGGGGTRRPTRQPHPARAPPAGKKGRPFPSGRLWKTVVFVLFLRMVKPMCRKRARPPRAKRKRSKE